MTATGSLSMITKGYKPPHPKTFGSKYKQRGNTPKIKKNKKNNHKKLHKTRVSSFTLA